MKTEKIRIADQDINIFFVTTEEEASLSEPQSYVVVNIFPEKNMTDTDAEKFVTNNKTEIVENLKRFIDEYTNLYSKYFVTYELLPTFMTFKNSSNLVAKIDTGLWIRYKEEFLEDVSRQLRAKAIELLEPFKENIISHGSNYMEVFKSRAEQSSEFIALATDELIAIANTILQQNDNTNQDLKDEVVPIVQDIVLECMAELTYGD